ncbi:MAG: penicillin-binding protein 2 [Flavobacteriaceae bacterium]|nr:penicillin-binding protein 2 [Flavobacteriaceae bacterium]
MITPGSNKRFTFFFIFLLVGLIFLARLVYLQVIDDSYEASARDNVLHQVTLYPSRGLIRDRHGELMVFNDAVYGLIVIPNKIAGMDTAEFCRLLGITPKGFKDRFDKLKRMPGWAPYRSFVFERELSTRTYAAFQEKLFDFPGFYVEVRTDRNYKYNNAAHILGYIGEVTDKDIEKSGGYYKQGDFFGISGIERAYEERLRGRKGVRYVLVDVLNREQGSYKEGKYDSLPIAGEDLTVTIDQRIQQLGEELMVNKIGSIVAIEPQTGELLCMVSSPGYDPNLFIGRERGNNYIKLLQDPLKPLFNRPIAAPYPPGSIFKIVMALIGQQEGVLTPSTTYSCGGGYNNGSNFVGCHPHGSPLDLRGAVQISCNAYFCHVFKTVIDNKKYRYVDEAFNQWRRHAVSFGIGIKLGVELPHVYQGQLPKQALYDKVYGQHHWKASTIISLAIGQGELGITPLQMANVVAILANRGYYIDPHVAKYFGRDKERPNDFAKHNTTVAREYFDVVVEGMHDVVKGGTGIIAAIPGIEVCGKTGTAQNPHGKDHSVFFAFAPKDNPKIAIAVVVENAGYGATWAAPIASLLMEKYLTDTVKRQYLIENMKKGNLMPDFSPAGLARDSVMKAQALLKKQKKKR